MRLVTSLLLSLSFALISFTPASAETTDPVGAVSISVPTGTTIFSNPFQFAKLYQGSVVSVSGADVTIDGTVPALDGPHYVQVISGTDVGRIFTIQSAAGSVVTLDSAPAGLATDDIVTIRKHFTVGDLGNVPAGTTVLLLNGNTSPTTGSFVFGSWTIDPNTVIFPGEGFVLNTGSAFDLVLFGAVSVDDVIYETSGGSFVVGNLDPVSGTADVLSNLISGLPAGSTITELSAEGAPIVYQFVFGSWNPDPSLIDVSNFKTIVVNSASGLDIVNTGFTF